MDWGTRHLTIILGTGGGTFANRRADHLTIFSNARGLSEGEEGGGGGGHALAIWTRLFKEGITLSLG